MQPTRRLHTKTSTRTRRPGGLGNESLVEGPGTGKAGVPVSTYASLVHSGQVDPEATVRWQIEYAGNARGDGGGGPRDGLAQRVIEAVPSISDVRGGVPALGFGVIHHEFNTKAKDTPKLLDVLQRFSDRWKFVRMIDGPIPETGGSGGGGGNGSGGGGNGSGGGGNGSGGGDGGSDLPVGGGGPSPGTPPVVQTGISTGTLLVGGGIIALGGVLAFAMSGNERPPIQARPPSNDPQQ